MSEVSMDALKMCENVVYRFTDMQNTFVIENKRKL